MLKLTSYLLGNERAYPFGSISPAERFTPMKNRECPLPSGLNTSVGTLQVPGPSQKQSYDVPKPD